VRGQLRTRPDLRDLWPYDPNTGIFTQEDPIGLAGGLNLYGFASGDPVNFSDPYGLCSQVGDSVRTTVTVDCGGGKTESVDIWIQKATPAQTEALGHAAARLEGGSAEFTPATVQWAYGVITDRDMVFSFPETVDGHAVLEGGLTKIGGLDSWVGFRSDVWSGVVAGDLGMSVGNLGFNVVTVIGHEGVHLLGGSHKQALAVTWSFK